MMVQRRAASPPAYRRASERAVRQDTGRWPPSHRRDHWWGEGTRRIAWSLGLLILAVLGMGTVLLVATPEARPYDASGNAQALDSTGGTPAARSPGSSAGPAGTDAGEPDESTTDGAVGVNGTPSPAVPPPPDTRPDMRLPVPPEPVVKQAVNGGVSRGGAAGHLMRTTGTKGVALTFDDGPSPSWTPKVLDLLKKEGVHATFCVLGTEARKYPYLIKRIVAEGHTLCNHSWHHEFALGTWSEDKIRANLQRTNDAIHAAVPGAPIAYFRHPGGEWTDAAIKVANEMGMRALHWSVDPWDWDKPGTQAITNRVLKNAKAGSIVLMHDGGGDRSETLAALPKIIKTLKLKYGLIPLNPVPLT